MDEENEYYRSLDLRMEQDGNVICKTLDCLIDTGSPISFMREGSVEKAGFRRDRRPNTFYGINGSKLNIRDSINVTVNFEGEPVPIKIYIVKNDTMSVSVVLGRDFVRIAKLFLKKQDENEINEIMHIQIEKPNPGPDPQSIIINDDITNEVKFQMRKLFDECYVRPPRPDEPKHENVMTLALTDSKPFHSNPRRLSYNEKSKLKIILDKWLKDGIIRPSESEYASPIVLTKKRNGELRMCIDFRMLNKITARDNFPLPLIEDQLDLLEGKKYFTTLDLKDGFFHIRMHEDSVKFTSFVSPLGQYECLRMPFGLKGAQLKFQRYVTGIFSEMIASGDVAVYLDDFLIATKTIERHFEVLEEVFRLLVENKLELRLDKCKFLQTTLEYLGYIITQDGIKPTYRGIE